MDLSENWVATHGAQEAAAVRESVFISMLWKTPDSKHEVLLFSDEKWFVPVAVDSFQVKTKLFALHLHHNIVGMEKKQFYQILIIIKQL